MSDFMLLNINDNFLVSFNFVTLVTLAYTMICLNWQVTLSKP